MRVSVTELAEGLHGGIRGPTTSLQLLDRDDLIRHSGGVA